MNLVDWCFWCWSGWCIYTGQIDCCHWIHRCHHSLCIYLLSFNSKVYFSFFPFRSQILIFQFVFDIFSGHTRLVRAQSKSHWVGEKKNKLMLSTFAETRSCTVNEITINSFPTVNPSSKFSTLIFLWFLWVSQQWSVAFYFSTLHEYFQYDIVFLCEPVICVYFTLNRVRIYFGRSLSRMQQVTFQPIDGDKSLWI